MSTVVVSVLKNIIVLLVISLFIDNAMTWLLVCSSVTALEVKTIAVVLISDVHSFVVQTPVSLL